MTGFGTCRGFDVAGFDSFAINVSIPTSLMFLPDEIGSRRYEDVERGRWMDAKKRLVMMC
jgi:hypothetical protein